MGLTSASAYNSLTWSQQKLNPGFSPTYQGPDTFQYPTNYLIEDTGVDTVYAVEGTLSPLASETIDLQNLTDFFGDALVFTRVYTLQIGATGADLLFGPGAVDPCPWFFADVNDRIVVKAGSDMMYNSTYPFTVDSGAKTLDFFNPSATTELTYKLAIIGGQGAGTTTTTTTTATTGTSSTTAVPTSTTTATSTTTTTTTTAVP